MPSAFDRPPKMLDRLAHAWNAFINLPSQSKSQQTYGYSSNDPSRNRLTNSNDKSIRASIYTRIAIDTAAVELRHVYLDENEHYLRTANTGLNNCLTLKANIDQGARAFKMDMVLTLLDKGYMAIVPVDTSDNPLPSGSWDIYTMRVGEIVTWYPQHVRVSLYNDLLGRKEELTLPKKMVAVVYNPFFSVMNEPNSTYQRLIRKLNLLDSIDEAASSGKLDIIIQLPYVVKSGTRKEQAEQRAKDIEAQLKGSKYGVAYTDGTEKITQLNRPAENNMLAQIQFLTGMLYSQLGLAETVFDGTADEKTLLNYYNRTIEPILAAIVEAMTANFLTKTARTQGQDIQYYRDMFKLLGISDIADLADKLTRNEILSSNEFRSLIGFKPSTDPNANKLLNKNLPVQSQPATSPHLTATPIRPQPLALTAGSDNKDDPEESEDSKVPLLSKKGE